MLVHVAGCCCDGKPPDPGFTCYHTFKLCASFYPEPPITPCPEFLSLSCEFCSRLRSKQPGVHGFPGGPGGPGSGDAGDRCIVRFTGQGFKRCCYIDTGEEEIVPIGGQPSHPTTIDSVGLLNPPVLIPSCDNCNPCWNRFSACILPNCPGPYPEVYVPCDVAEALVGGPGINHCWFRHGGICYEMNTTELGDIYTSLPVGAVVADNPICKYESCTDCCQQRCWWAMHRCTEATPDCTTAPFDVWYEGTWNESLDQCDEPPDTPHVGAIEIGGYCFHASAFPAALSLVEPQPPDIIIPPPPNPLPFSGCLECCQIPTQSCETCDTDCLTTHSSIQIPGVTVQYSGEICTLGAEADPCPGSCGDCPSLDFQQSCPAIFQKILTLRHINSQGPFCAAVQQPDCPAIQAGDWYAVSEYIVILHPNDACEGVSTIHFEVWWRKSASVCAAGSYSPACIIRSPVQCDLMSFQLNGNLVLS